MTTENDKTRTITLTGRPPVTIKESAWPKIAGGRVHDGGEFDHQANRSGTLIVRQHADGRAIVYGIYVTCWQNERNKRAGELLDAGADLPAAIYRVADAIGYGETELAESTIADLPPVELD